MTSESKPDWLNAFVENNVWALLALIFAFAVFYGTVNFRVKALEQNQKTYEEALTGIVINQQNIIRLQGQQEHLTQDINEIKDDIKDIKRSMGLVP